VTERAGPDLSRFASIASAGFAVGVTLFTVLVVSLGVREIAGLVASAGVGLLWVALFHVVPIAASALGWYTIVAAVDTPRLAVVLAARWVAESINQLLPALHVGGNVVRARRLGQSGVPPRLAAATVVVDITLHLLAQLLFTMLGLSLLLTRTGASGVGRIAAGLVLAVLAAGGFYVLQRRGLFSAMTFLLGRAFRGGDWAAVSEGAGEIDRWIRRLYEQRRMLAVSEVWHALSWLLGAGETWLALRFLGHPVGLAAALVIESLGEAIRTAAFPVPAALGVQEGGLVLLGDLFGLTSEVSMALSLVKRVRELALGVPGLVFWQLGGLREARAGAEATR
jgi:putative membrane protein